MNKIIITAIIGLIIVGEMFFVTIPIHRKNINKNQYFANKNIVQVLILDNISHYFSNLRGNIGDTTQSATEGVVSIKSSYIR